MSSRAGMGRFGFAVLALAAVAVSSSQAAGTDSNRQFTAQEFLEPIKYLASDRLKGRGDGTPELDKAARYIAGRFRKFGLQPAGDRGTYLQHFTLVVGAKLGRNNSLRCRQGPKTGTWQVQRSFIPLSFSANSSIDAPLVFAGYGITAPEYHYDDYTGLEATGKIVIVLRHEPQEDDDNSTFAGKQLTSHAEIANKAINAKNHGAVGMIVVNDVGNHPGEPDDLFKLGQVSGPQEMSIPIVQVKAEVVDRWIESSGHRLEQLRQAIDRDLSNHSFTLDPSTRVALKVDIERIRRQVANVVAELLGSDPKLADQHILVGAHYDHLGLGAHNSLAPREIGKIHHGADDNASGTAGVLELADALAHSAQKPRRSIVFICFAGEELGLLGSNYYASHPTYPLEQTIAMLNLDMIGRVAKNKLYVSGTGTSPGFRQLVQEANQPLNFEIAYSNSGYGASDQTSFTVKEIPVLFFFSGLHSDYHKPSDTWDKIDPTQGAHVVELVANVISGLDAGNDKPPYVRVAEPASSGTGGGGGYGAYFGSIPDFGEVEHGVKFSDVRDGSPAAKAGLKASDILIEFDGKTIENLYDFTYALRSHKPGERVSVTVMRGDQKITRDVTLEVRK